MPQTSQILGVNSVTNIELDKGVLPAPIIRNADWFENFDQAVSLRAFSTRRKDSGGQEKVNSIPVPCLYRIVANCRFTRGSGMEGVNSGWMAGPGSGAAMPGSAQYRIKLDLASGDQCEHEQRAEYATGDQREGDDHVLGQ